MSDVVLVTGASRGIGRAIAVELAKEGYALAVNFQGNRAAAEETVRLCRAAGVSSEAFRADVSDYAQAQALISDVTEKMGGLYGVVANAGMGPRFAYISETDPSEWKRMMDVNLNGVFHTFHAASPHLVKQKRGRMIAISSIATRYRNPGFGPYTVSKAAVDALVHVMGKEMAQYGVRVTAVAPGLFDTEMGSRVIDRYGRAAVEASIPAQRIGRPEEIGWLIAFLLSDKADFITGDVINITGGGRGVSLRP
jgi:3-oxoacyl-[acyl-carrier protein] reductase